MVFKYASFDSNNMNGNVIQPHGTVSGGVGTIYLALDENIDISNVQVVWKLTEPIYYQLTPQQLLTLKGTNNIWANTNGQTEVKYWTYKIDESESDQDDSTSNIVDIGLADSMILVS